MRIAIFTNNYIPNPYGVSASIESFRNQFEKRGHIVYVFAPHVEGYNDQNSRVFRYPSIDIKYKISFPLAIPYSFKISCFLSGLDFDIIHSQHPNLLGTAAKRWAKKKNIPLIFTWHTLYDRYAHFAPLVPPKLAANWIIKKAVKYANQSDWVVVPTKSAEEIIREWGMNNGKVTVIPTGVEEELYQNSEGDLVREKYKIKKEDILLLTVSRLTEEKNVEFLFDSLIFTLRDNKNVRFLVVGEGYLLPKLREKVKNYDLENKVIFTGIVEKNEIKNYYASADIFVYASKSETQGMIISEAMYMGLPVVAIRASGVKDLVCDKITGYLVNEDKKEFCQAVEKLIASKNLRKIFSASAEKIAKENLTSAVSTIKMFEVYEKAINYRRFKTSENL